MDYIDKLNKSDRNRVYLIIKNTFDLNAHRFSYVQHTGFGIDKSMKELNPRLFEKLKILCKEEYNKFLHDSNMTDGFEYKQRVSINDTNKKSYYDWQECTERNDFGLKLLLKQHKENIDKRETDLIKCIELCFSDVPNKSDFTLKEDFNDCYNKYFETSEMILKSVSQKLKEIESKL